MLIPVKLKIEEEKDLLIVSSTGKIVKVTRVITECKKTYNIFREEFTYGRKEYMENPVYYTLSMKGPFFLACEKTKTFCKTGVPDYMQEVHNIEYGIPQKDVEVYKSSYKIVPFNITLER